MQRVTKISRDKYRNTEACLRCVNIQMETAGDQMIQPPCQHPLLVLDRFQVIHPNKYSQY